MISIGDLRLGDIPQVVGVIDHIVPVNDLRELKKKGVDLFEVRLDRYNIDLNKTLEYLESINAVVPAPLIGTVRETELNKQSRVDIFRAMVPFVDCVDIELGTPVWKKMLDAASGKTIMVSEHDFEKMPDRAGLEDLVKRALDQGAHIVKIAAMARTSSDVTRLLRFTEDTDVPVVAIAMGEVGRISRVMAPLFGSLFTYGYIGESVAPGQLSALKLAEELSLYFGRGKKNKTQRSQRAQRGKRK
ncbi:MAG: type I 3-dehydroquinate dehydratase [Chitinispirillaceae bacterium]